MGPNRHKSQDIESTYLERFPWHAYATDDPRTGIRMYEAAEALTRAIVQHNARHSIAWLVFDLDSPTASTDWIDRDAPVPNILAINPANGHGHLLYGLIKPVHDYAGASDKARRYFSAVDVALTAKLGADPGYSKLLSKNPIHERWETVYPRQSLYTLEELSRGLDLDLDRRRRLPAVGLGRNCTLFETLRRWAYQERRRPQMYFSEEMFREAVLWRGLAYNAEFEPPLPHSEVRMTAKSIAKWTWRNMSPEGFEEWAEARRRRAVEARKERALELRYQIQKTAWECPTLTQAEIATLHGVHQATVSRHLSLSEQSLSDISHAYRGGAPDRAAESSRLERPFDVTEAI